MGRRPPVAAIAPVLSVASIVAFLLVGPYKAKEKQALKPGAASLVDQGCVVVPVASVPRRAHHSVFDGLGPVDAAPAECDLVNIPERVPGEMRGDNDKRACKRWLDKLTAEDVVFSLGSHNEFDFEEQMLSCAPKSHIATFDCTLQNDDPTRKPKTNRVSFHPYCVGDERRDKFRDWTATSMMALATAAAEAATVTTSRTGRAARVGFLKMDIEGFEWTVLLEVLRAPADRLPRQIAVELHLATHCDLGVAHFAVGTGVCHLVNHRNKLKDLRAKMRARGYLMVDRNDNPWCGHCSEVLFVLGEAEGGALAPWWPRTTDPGPSKLIN